MLEDKIQQDVKIALLAGNRFTATVLRGLKSSLLYAKIASSTRDTAMDDETVRIVLQKESKKRQESADLYERGGNAERAATERREKAIIDAYLPAQLSENAVRALVDIVILEIPADQRALGVIIAAVKQRTGSTADGATIARMVKEKLA